MRLMLLLRRDNGGGGGGGGGRILRNVVQKKNKMKTKRRCITKKMGIGGRRRFGRSFRNKTIRGRCRGRSGRIRRARLMI